MARDPFSILIEPWAETGDRATPASEGINPAEGWDDSYSASGGQAPQREVFNYMFRQLTGMLHEINTRGGVLDWDAGVNYVHPAIVINPTDGALFYSIRDNINRPPTSSPLDWRLLREAMGARDSVQVQAAIASALGTYDNRAASDQRYARQGLNLSDLSSATAARDNLSVRSRAEITALLAPFLTQAQVDARVNLFNTTPFTGGATAGRIGLTNGLILEWGQRNSYLSEAPVFLLSLSAPTILTAYAVARVSESESIDSHILALTSTSLSVYYTTISNLPVNLLYLVLRR